MSAFLATYWPILALAYVFVVLLILGVFRLGARADDLRDEFADGDWPHVPSISPHFHSNPYDSEAQQDHA